MKARKTAVKRIATKTTTESADDGNKPVAPKTRRAAKVKKPAVVAAPSAPVTEPSKPKRKAAAKKAAIKVPPILLEGDQPSPPAASGPGERYALGPVPPRPHLAGAETAGELPEAYGTKQLLLTARDPQWLYVRWDLTRPQQREYNALSADGHLVVRIFVDAARGRPFSQTHVHPESTHWFIHVGRGGTKYVAELGYYQPDGEWVALATSEPTLTPPDTMSEDFTVQFATIPIEVPFEELMALARETIRQNIPLSEVLLQLRARGHQGFAPATEPPARWTPEQEQALSSIITMDKVRRVWMGSLEITELIRRQLQQEMASMAAAQLPTSPAGAVSSVSSPFGGLEQRKGFWFNVNAELILYGATEPDARVTIGGREIKLRPDGTFSYRFALPDGKFELPAVAISSDRTDGRAADLRFSRATEYRGDVGAHPQDPRLKPPLAENVA